MFNVDVFSCKMDFSLLNACDLRFKKKLDFFFDFIRRTHLFPESHDFNHICLLELQYEVRLSALFWMDPDIDFSARLLRWFWLLINDNAVVKYAICKNWREIEQNSAPLKNQLVKRVGLTIRQGRYLLYYQLRLFLLPLLGSSKSKLKQTDVVLIT